MKSLSVLLLLLLLQACVPKGGGNNIVKGGGSAERSGDGDDPLAPFAWHLENTGQTSFASSPGIAGQDMKIKPVIDSGIKGAGVRIAVSDSGVEIQHPDLYGNQLSGEHRNYSSTNSSAWRNADPYPQEEESHGTAVSGLIAALGWNGIGSRGVAPSAKFAGFYFLGSHTGETNASYEAKTLDQMTGNFDIYNYSYGYAGCAFFGESDSVLNAYKLGITNQRGGKGAIYVKAAGNDYMGYLRECYGGTSSNPFLGNTNTSEDQAHPYLILVGAVNASGQRSSYSTPGSGLWVSAAGGEYGDAKPAMITTDIQGCSKGLSASDSHVTNSFNRGRTNQNTYCNYTNGMNGTSSAAPVLSGIIALMLEARPELTWRDVKHILAVTAEKINFSTTILEHPGGPSAVTLGHVYDLNYTVNHAGFSFSNLYGFGRVNAEAAVNMAKTYSLGSMGGYTESTWRDSGSLSLPIPDDSMTGVESTINFPQNLKIESVQIRITATHNYVGDLSVELTSPLGTTSRLLLGNSNLKDKNFQNQMLLTNAFYGEPSNGDWKIKVVDTVSGDSGTLTNWKLKISGKIQ